MTWVDFRKQEPDPMQRLLWGITGRRPTTAQNAQSIKASLFDRDMV